MMWQTTWRVVARHRELALALTFAVAAGWELVEFLILEGPRGARGPVPLVLRSAQILLILGVTWVVIRAWQERARYEEALAAMVEKVLVAQEEERRRMAYDVHDGIAQLIVSAKKHVDTCRDLGGRDEARARHELGRAAQRLEGAIVETRRVLRALRPSAMDSPDPGGRRGRAPRTARLTGSCPPRSVPACLPSRSSLRLRGLRPADDRSRGLDG